MRHTGDSHYLHTILPLGLFLLIGGVFFAVLALTTDRIKIPSVESLTLSRMIVFGWGSLFAVLGTGWIFRAKWAWIVTIAVAACGTLASIVALYFEELQKEVPDFWSVGAASIIGISVVGVIYLAGRPYFTK